MKKVDLFSKEWIEARNSNIKSLEAMEIDKPDHVFSGFARDALAHFCLAMLALDALPTRKKVQVYADAEKVCNGFGHSFLPREITVTKCLTSRHVDCSIAYVNSSTGSRIVCQCRCHKRRASRIKRRY